MQICYWESWGDDRCSSLKIRYYKKLPVYQFRRKKFANDYFWAGFNKYNSIFLFKRNTFITETGSLWFSARRIGFMGICQFQKMIINGISKSFGRGWHSFRFNEPGNRSDIFSRWLLYSYFSAAAHLRISFLLYALAASTDRSFSDLVFRAAFFCKEL